MNYVYEYAKSKNENTSLINLSDGQVECYRGPDEDYNEATKFAAKEIMDADIWLIGSPIYNSFFSSALKNLFEWACLSPTNTSEATTSNESHSISGVQYV